MRSIISDFDLETAVNLICRVQSEFSCYDITGKLRLVLPEHEISHDRVKQYVENYVTTDNTVTVNNNGTYRVFSKTKQLTRLEKLLQQKNTASPLPAQVVQSVPVPTTQKKELLPLQSEGRINITTVVRENFPSASSVYIEKVNDKILVTSDYKNLTGGIAYQCGPKFEIRLRTGFKSKNALVDITKDLITISSN